MPDVLLQLCESSSKPRQPGALAHKPSQHAPLLIRRVRRRHKQSSTHIRRRQPPDGPRGIVVTRRVVDEEISTRVVVVVVFRVTEDLDELVRTSDTGDGHPRSLNDLFLLSKADPRDSSKPVEAIIEFSISHRESEHLHGVVQLVQSPHGHVHITGIVTRPPTPFSVRRGKHHGWTPRRPLRWWTIAQAVHRLPLLKGFDHAGFNRVLGSLWGEHMHQGLVTFGYGALLYSAVLKEMAMTHASRWSLRRRSKTSA